jgi:hypothetical protein
MFASPEARVFLLFLNLCKSEQSIQRNIEENGWKAVMKIRGEKQCDQMVLEKNAQKEQIMLPY